MYISPSPNDEEAEPDGLIIPESDDIGGLDTR